MLKKQLTLKNVLITLGFALFINSVMAADVVCEKENGWWYPKNDKAIKIATHLKVKTCSGGRFLKTVKELGLTTNAKPRRKGKKDLKKSLGL